MSARTRSPRFRSVAALSLACFACAGALALAQACTSTSPTQSVGDRVVNDTHTQPTPTSTGDDDSGAPLFDAGYEHHSYDVPDGYAPNKICDECACASSEAGAGFCFGGGSGATAPPASCTGPREAGVIEVGCNPFPPECASAPTCECLIDALHGKLPCYTVCSNKGGFRIYCPNP